MRVVALGVGDEHGDEAAGLRVAALLSPRIPPEVELYIPGTVDTALVVELEGTSHLLVLDTVDFGRSPGTMVRFDSQSMRPCALSVSVHAYGVADLLVNLGQRSTAPEEVVVLALQPGESMNGTMSAMVEAAIPDFVREAESVLRGWLGLGPLDPPWEGREAHPINC